MVHLIEHLEQYERLQKKGIPFALALCGYAATVSELTTYANLVSCPVCRQKFSVQEQQSEAGQDYEGLEGIEGESEVDEEEPGDVEPRVVADAESESGSASSLASALSMLIPEGTRLVEDWQGWMKSEGTRVLSGDDIEFVNMIGLYSEMNDMPRLPQRIVALLARLAVRIPNEESG